jgi:hypothetical protein
MLNERQCKLEQKLSGLAQYIDEPADSVGHRAAIRSLKEEVKITITNFQKNRPITKGYKRLQVLNLPSYVRWIKDYANEIIYKKYKGIETSVNKKTIRSLVL